MNWLRKLFGMKPKYRVKVNSMKWKNWPYQVRTIPIRVTEHYWPDDVSIEDIMVYERLNNEVRLIPFNRTLQ